MTTDWKWYEAPKNSSAVGNSGYNTRVPCPKCGEDIIYNGNYFCKFWAYPYTGEEGTCDWALSHDDNTGTPVGKIDKEVWQKITEGWNDKTTSGSAPYCPDKPCNFCHGNSSVVIGRNEDGSPRYQTSWDWCQSNSTCAATVDWDRVFGYE